MLPRRALKRASSSRRLPPFDDLALAVEVAPALRHAMCCGDCFDRGGAAHALATVGVFNQLDDMVVVLGGHADEFHLFLCFRSTILQSPYATDQASAARRAARRSR